MLAMMRWLGRLYMWFCHQARHYQASFFLSDGCFYALYQKFERRDEGDRIYRIYISKMINHTQCIYSMIEKEATVIIKAMEKWRHLLVGVGHSLKKVTINFFTCCYPKWICLASFWSCVHWYLTGTDDIKHVTLKQEAFSKWQEVKQLK